MTYRNLPLSTRERITDYYEHKYTQKRLFNEAEILAEVSLPIRNVRFLILCFTSENVELNEAI